MNPDPIIAALAKSMLAASAAVLMVLPLRRHGTLKALGPGSSLRGKRHSNRCTVSAMRSTSSMWWLT